ncbi:MAG TPA: NUDIX hydrolase [Opitutaceae bacterium]|nr:NUDIX hydrolase [Opitutaceae bacterium]
MSEIRKATAGRPSVWERLADAAVDHFRVFRVRRTRYRHPRDRREGEFVVIESNDWVNVLALTDDGRMVLVRQFRFGVHDFTLEIPGGVIETGEDPVAAGVRELREETGFVGRDARLLAQVRPNPAIQANRCHFVLVEGCVPTASTQLDPFEEIEVSLLPVDEVIAQAERGEITHALVIDALFFLRAWREGRPR